MICRILRGFERFLREHQDPRCRDAPWIPPRVWHGSDGGHLKREELVRLNVKDIGLDPGVVAQQLINRKQLAMSGHAQEQHQVENPR